MWRSSWRENLFMHTKFYCSLLQPGKLTFLNKLIGISLIPKGKVWNFNSKPCQSKVVEAICYIHGLTQVITGYKFIDGFIYHSNYSSTDIWCVSIDDLWYLFPHSSRFKSLLQNRPAAENTCIEISHVKYNIFYVSNRFMNLLNRAVLLYGSCTMYIA